MLYIKMKNNKGWFWVIGSGVCVLIVVAIVLIVMEVMKNSYLNIYVTPLSAKVIIDGKEYQNGTYKFYPGKHVAVIESEGFESKQVDLEMSSNKATNLFTFLNGDDNYYEYVNNSDDYAVLKQVVKYDEEAQKIIDRINKAEEIYKQLPKAFKVGDNYYGIEQGSNCTKILCLRVRNFVGNNYDLALDNIRQMGYDVERYEIINTDGIGEKL